MPITTTPSGGPQGEFSTYTPIYSTTLSSTASTITFSNIPSTYTDLQLVCQTLASGSALNLTVNVNGDTTSSYSITSLYGRSEGAGTTVSSIRAANATYALANYGTATVTDVLSISRIDFMNYSNSAVYKPIIARAATAPGNTTFSGNELVANTWRSTAPITSITLGGGTFASGSTFTIYGIKAAATQFIPTKAFGGDIVASDGTYAYHAFTSTGRFLPQVSLTADILVIAGGGGTASATGGGGAGGIVYAASQSLTTAQYTITVGGGGAGTTGATGNKGTNTTFSSLITANGGGAGTRTGGASANGGSGGGVANGYSAGTANAGSGGTAYANAGAVAGVNVAYGGGGGAGQAGQTTGVGGNGLNTWNAWATVTNTGVGGYYAGGGGGPINSPTPSPGNSGGLGGGGASGDRSSTTGTAGVPGSINTGSGAGGGGVGNNVDGAGATGGSGIVIVRYAL